MVQLQCPVCAGTTPSHGQPPIRSSTYCSIRQSNSSTTATTTSNERVLSSPCCKLRSALFFSGMGIRHQSINQSTTRLPQPSLIPIPLIVGSRFSLLLLLLLQPVRLHSPSTCGPGPYLQLDISTSQSPGVDLAGARAYLPHTTGASRNLALLHFVVLWVPWCLPCLNKSVLTWSRCSFPSLAPHIHSLAARVSIIKRAHVPAN